MSAKSLLFACCAVAVLACAFAPRLFAQQYTWTGAVDSSWSNSANWTPGGIPSGPTTEVIFDGAGNGRTAIDLDMQPTLSRITFDTSGAASYTLGAAGQTMEISWESEWGSTNNGIQVGAGVTNSQTILADIYFASSSEYYYQTQIRNDSAASLDIAGALRFNDVPYRGQLVLQSNGQGTNTISGPIVAGTAALAVVVNYFSDAGTWQLLGTNSFTEGVTLYYGTLVINSIADINVPCSLGTSGEGNTILTLGYGGGGQTGGPNSTLRYIGPDASSDRPWTSEANAGTSVVFDVVSSALTMNGAWTGGGGSRPIGLQKTGAGTLQLNATNNEYCGPTVISGGALGVSLIADGGKDSSIGKSSAAATNLVFDGGTLQYTSGEYGETPSDRAFSITPGKTASFDITENVWLEFGGSVPFTTGGLWKTGGATSKLLLSGNNAYTGPTTVAGGWLVAGSSSTPTGGPFGINSDTDLTAAGTLVLHTASNSYNVAIGSLTGLEGSAVDLGGQPSGAGWLTIASSNNATFAGVISSDFGGSVGSGGLIKTTPSATGPGGMQTLTGINTYGGATYIQSAAYPGSPASQAGGITLSGANGSIASSSAIAISGGATLAIENFGTAINTNRIGDTTTVTMYGGTLGFATDSAAPGVSETLGALVLNGGNNTISNGQAGFGKSSTLTFASFARNGSATVNFAGTGLGLNDQNRVFFTDAPALGDWALYNGVGYATYNSTNGIVEAAYADVTRLSSGSKIIYTATNGNIRIIDGAGTPGPIELSSTNTQIAGLAQTATGGPVTIDTSGKTFGITSVLVGSNAGALTIGTAPGSGQLTSSFDAISLINNSTNSLVVNATVIDAPLEGGSYPIAVTKMGAGTVFLAGTNTYTGVTTLGQGVLSISTLGNGGQAGGLGAAGNASTNIVFDGGRLHYTGTNTSTDRGFTVTGSGSRLDTDADFHISGAAINLASGSLTIGGAGATTILSLITGAGALDKDGASTLTLLNTNTFTGRVTIRGGAVSVTNIGNGGQAGNLGAASNASTNLVLDGGTLVYGGTGTATSDRGMRVGSGGGAFINATEGALIAFVGGTSDGVQIAPQGTFDIGGPGNVAFANVISGVGSLRKSGGGLLLLENPGNSFAGGVTISGGTIAVQGMSDGGVAGYLGAASADPANLVFDGGTLSLSQIGTTQSTDRGFTITAGKTATISVTNNASLLFSGDVPTTTGALTKTGNGTLTLSGDLAFTGEATASAGRLNIDGTLGPGATPGSSLDVAAGATLGGSGTIQRDVYVSGTHSPGSSPGLQTIDGAVIYNPGATVLWELAASTTAGRGTNFDGIDGNGHVANFLGSTTLDLVFNAPGSTVKWSDGLWGANRQWVVYSNFSVSGFGNLALDSDWLDSDGALFGDLLPGSTFSIARSGNEIVLNYTGVPEPSTAAFLALSAVTLAIRALRRRR